MSDLAMQNINYLPGVGPKKAELLKQELKVASYEDLLYYFPYKYVDRSKFYAIREVNTKLPYIQVKGRFTSLSTVGTGRQSRMTATFTDGTGVLELIWFKGHKYVKESINSEAEYIVFGKPSAFNGRINIVHPELEKVNEAQVKISSALQAFYNTTEKMKKGFLNSKAISKLQQNVFLSFQGKISETLPASILEKYKLLNLHESLKAIHFPPNPQLLEKAQLRLKFEELFYIQLNILRQRNQRTSNIKGHLFGTVGQYLNEFYAQKIPFELTNAQKRVIKEIRRDMGSGKQMNRLLQGDVGSGKTLVALMVMLIALDNRFQTCLMAPTEILATQHFETISQMVEGLNIKVALLTGSSKKKERELIDKDLQSGKLQILIGTHALLEDKVVFNNLGLVVVDEQHRFGVAQRARLWRKNTQPPHVLVMTATPIPRTLAMTIYGDLEVSVIDELPPGRKPIETAHYFHNRRNNLNKFIKGELDKGRQVYVVYPLIEESEKMDFKNLGEGYEYMQRVFPDYKVSMVHGKMRPAEKDEAMQEFASNRSQILVSTTVIEVGVNVPNASVMVIESAERFGLSQLHQLRGRVGRGAEQSFCILMTSYKLSDETRKRMDIMTRSTDGFEIAEADLKLRGPGDLEGTQQSGLPFTLKIANLGRDGQILQFARQVAEAILNNDPLLEKQENYILNKQLKKLASEKMNWSMIS
ncbi:ATP-dependent DNA helicase RecG [Carboxylicivirga mesophila]|uniref:ATP-dependent DNA helicase RecG n=1 Tax=Carboxylicivirga mesophila TaxID=1166478 RepID=A0ABS5KBF6_9BACT|nr:ATP-dependent DNA helicase RecG [Carboxylicivirga mesophila]MBS2211861.1 ATP-dependent DNA helicase RecG [Carboxylicivirga mesophila]